MDGLETKRGGWGGGQASHLQTKRICITILCCKHGDNMMLLCYGKHGWLHKSLGCGVRGGGGGREEENEPRSQEASENTAFVDAVELEMLYLPCLHPFPLPNTVNCSSWAIVC